MCGFVAAVRPAERDRGRFDLGLASLAHRGPDDSGNWQDRSGSCLMGHRRLSVIDLSSAGRQPFSDPSGRYHLVFNGEIYNYIELRVELRSRWEFQTNSDTEVLLAAFVIWGEACLHKFIGMFSFAVWDSHTQELFAARDRFGVKPLFYSCGSGDVVFVASEAKALHALGVSTEPDVTAWRTYFLKGLYDHSDNTFFRDVRAVPPGHFLRVTLDSGNPSVCRWYDVADRVEQQGLDLRDDGEVLEELYGVLVDAIQLRLRSDVPVGVSLSGGLDSALLLSLIRRIKNTKGGFQSFTFAFGDERYDETQWTGALLEGSGIVSNVCLVGAKEVPGLASRVQTFQDEPFGGLPTLGMAAVHERARELGVTVLLDGNGLDEAWAGYDYYQRLEIADLTRGPVQGTIDSYSLAPALVDDFVVGPTYGLPDQRFEDALLNFQHRDLTASKIPRAMRFADRASMMASRELREPFLDHRIVELGLRQPSERKIRDGQGKWLLRVLAKDLLPASTVLAPKRPVQTPQREWLRGPLAGWVETQIESALSGWGSEWFDRNRTHALWSDYLLTERDNSFPIWQIVSLGLMKSSKTRETG